jgi:hypothetical protein
MHHASGGGLVRVSSSRSLPSLRICAVSVMLRWFTSRRISMSRYFSGRDSKARVFDGNKATTRACDPHGCSADLWRFSQLLLKSAYVGISRRIGRIPNSMDRQSGFRQRKPKHEVMLAWRFALLAYLDVAIKANVLRSDLSVDELTQILHAEEKRN